MYDGAVAEPANVVLDEPLLLSPALYVLLAVDGVWIPITIGFVTPLAAFVFICCAIWVPELTVPFHIEVTP